MTLTIQWRPSTQDLKWASLSRHKTINSEAPLPDLTNKYLEQIEAVIDSYRGLIKRWEKGPNRLESQRLITLCRAVVHRVAGPGSPYRS